MNRKDLSKVYQPSDVEEKWYKNWENSGAFSPNDKGQDPFTIMIPPPNVTGILHIGHILNNTIQDVLIRRSRMQGKCTLWMPGTDHASIATEAKVTKKLSDNGINKKDIGREAFLEHAWKWKEEYGGTILRQLKRVGASCDWDKTTFTMDENYSKAVTEVFVRLYNDGLIYKGEKIINWDPKGLTALSDEEVIYSDVQSHLWHFRYPIKNSKKHLVVATTRPETMLGDTAVAVNPKDDRYKNLIGKKVILPIVKREIPIVADDFVDMEFGTGCVKVTPAHDPNDFEIGSRHDLEVINIFNKDATLNKRVPKQFSGLSREQARQQVVEKIEDLNLLDKIEDYTHSVGHSERTNAVVEPYLSSQWFVKMEALAKPAIDSVRNKEINFYPKRWEKTYFHWMENIRDWCISRQLWWGHRIPVWYKDDEVYCGVSEPDGEGWQQDSDVLDTWFSSWLWPFATLGWPDKSHDLKRFYPTNDIVTGPDIIFFWIARMIMAGLYFTKEIPFKNVYFNGLIRDSKGKKMSKSLGNSPDPLDLMNKFGSDALRVGLLLIAPQGLDILFSEEKIEHGRNFMNKVWNSARFITMQGDSTMDFEDARELMDPTDKWILSRLSKTIQDVENAYDSYKLNEAVKLVYNLVWKDYCDWYIEMSKTRFYGKNVTDREVCLAVSRHVLCEIIKMMHPYTPHITEEIWSYIKPNNINEMLIVSTWPSSISNDIDEDLEHDFGVVTNIISSIRNMRASLNVSPSKEADLFIRANKDQYPTIKSYEQYICSLARINKILCGEDIEKPAQSSTSVVNGMEIFIPLKGLIDLDAERTRLQGQIDDINGRFLAVSKKLENKNFVERAPKEVVDHEQNKRDSYKLKLDKLIENLGSLNE